MRAVAKQRLGAGGRVVAAECVAKERIKTDCRIVGAGREADERIIPLDGVVVG